MLLLISPSFHTAVLKLPLLLTNAALTYYVFSPPKQVPTPEEQKKFDIADNFTQYPNINLYISYAAKTVMCSLSLVEALVLLAANVPTPLSSRVLDILLPVASSPSSQFHLSSSAFAGFLLGISGNLIRIWCQRTLGRLFTWHLAIRKNHVLVTSGPYAIVRHPSYTGWYMFVAGQALLLLSPGSYFVESSLARSRIWKVAAGAYLLYLASTVTKITSRIWKEDAVMRREFGDEWDAWAGRVPYKVIPYIY